MLTKWIIPILCFAVFILMIFASGMFKPLGHDENMYCAGGALMAQGKLIYRDFSYIAHPPYHALVLAVVYKLSNTTHYLFTGRFISIICDCMSALFIFLIYRRTVGNAMGVYVDLAATAVYIFNPYVNYASGFAWNHDIVMLCVIASFWLYAAKAEKLCYWRICGVAALLTFAVFTRTTSVFLWLLFFIMILTETTQIAGQKVKAMAVFLLTSIAVSVLPLYIVSQAPKAFWIDVYLIPQVNGRYLHSIGMAYDKIYLVSQVFFQPIYVITTLLAIGCWTAAFIWYKNNLKIAYRPMLLAAAITIVFFFIALIVPTSWEQYFAMPVPFIIISMAYPLAALQKDIHRKLVNITAASMVFLSILLNPAPLAAVLDTLTPSSYVPMQIHSISEDIASKAGKGNRILTLAPLFAIEGGCTIYPEVAAGPFVYRIADSMTQNERSIANAVGPLEITQLTQQTPPAAVLLGAEPSVLEEHLRRIVKPDWKTTTYFDGRLALFFH